MQALVLGVNGMVGRAVAASLVQAGWSVTGTGRSVERFPAELAAAGVHFEPADRNDPRRLAEVVGDGTDVIVDCLCYTAEHARQLLEHRGRIGSAIVISSKAVYVDDHGRHSNSDVPPRFDGPVVEGQPVMEPDFSGDYESRCGYGANKVAAELLLRASEWPVTVLRPSRVHGPGSARPREWFIVRRILDGRTRVPLAHGGRTANHPTAAVNIGALATACAARPAARVLNVADPDAPTAAEITVAVAAAVAGAAAGAAAVAVAAAGAVADNAVAAAGNAALEPVGLPDDAPAEWGGSPWPNWPPFFLDTTASEAVAGYRPVPYAVAVRDEVRWLLSLTSSQKGELDADPYFSGRFDYAVDDRALEFARSTTPAATDRT